MERPWYKINPIHNVKAKQNEKKKICQTFLIIDATVVILIHSQSVPITTKIVSSNPVHGEVYSIQHYVAKFVSDLQHVGCFHRVLRFPSLIKLTITI